MADASAPTLSAHLLAEASRFIFYPKRASRTKLNLETQEVLDKGLRRLVEWRATFSPRTETAAEEFLNESPVLDQLYSRELLRAVPGIVERTRSLARVTLARDTGGSFVYLREAANCFIFGLPQACVALSRAAVEIPLRRAASRQFGEAAVARAGLYDLLKDFAVRGRLLSRETLNRADRVRIAADKVLHDKPTSDNEALEIFEDARVVVSELTRVGEQRR